MILILFFTVIGFLSGLVYVMIKRKIRPGRILVATLLGLLTAAIWKVFADNLKGRGRRWRY